MSSSLLNGGGINLSLLAGAAACAGAARAELGGGAARAELGGGAANGWVGGRAAAGRATPTKASASGVASTLVHETGHAWSMKDWGAKDSVPWQAWKSAAARDGLPPSQYGAHNLDEDLAETQTLFLESRGRPEYAMFKALYPHRFAILEQRFGGSP